MTASGDTEVLDLMQRWASAEQGNDAGLLGGLLAERFVGVGPLGFVLTREQWLQRFQGGLHNSRFVLENPQVFDHGQAAVVVADQVQQTTWQGRDNSGRFRLTVTAVRPDDRWQVAGVHVGPLQQPPAPPPQ
jgi:ketosteroid isomerase-like protein